MANFIGRSGSLLLFTQEEKAVVVDSELDLIVASGSTEILRSSRYWADGETTESAKEAASQALLSNEFVITASAKRLYTIPRGVQNEAKKALEWRKENNRGGTPVGLNTARTLAKGGQVGIEKIRHIAKYFPRHEVDKKGKGWAPGEPNFPSNGRIAWALWGGDAARRWASAIVERENKEALTAGAYEISENQPTIYGEPDVHAFEKAYDLEGGVGPEFLARVRLDGSGMDRLYKIDPDGEVYLWDDGIWDNFGRIGADIWDYDRAIDHPQDSCEKTHIVVDPESAIYMASRFDRFPGVNVTVDDIDSQEAQMVSHALSQIDWDFIDSTIVAAADPAATDGTYTPEERSANAAEQLRDASGQFATAGSRVMVGGQSNLLGTINTVNQTDGTVGVKLDDGREITVSAKSVATVDPNTQPTATTEYGDVPPIDTSGILGEPRTPANRVGAQIPGTLPAMDRESLTQLLSDWPAYVQSQRAAFAPSLSTGRVKVQGKDSLDLGEKGRAFEQKAGKNLTLDAYDHPLLKKWLQGTNKQGYNNAMWYNPITAAAGEKEKTKALTPETTDVQPIYMAVVDADDPRSVLNLISLVPASSKSTAPMVYSRKEGKWERDPQTLADLGSPTPPPVVPLDTETLNDVLIQVDESQGVTASLVLTVLFGNDPIIAAGGLDRNRGNAEKLRRYWVRGEGAAKIRWGQGGDWKRCVRHLTKYLGPRAKGYCQLRHKEALGYYTSTHAKMDRAKHNSIQEFTYELDGYNPRSFATEVSESDLNLPLSAIITEADALYDFAWEPEDEVVFMLQELASCKEKEFALLAAGGLDRNRGQAEKLRRYWTVGKGGLKIRWGTPGDWTRCVRQLNKYMGPRAKGYCALRHKEMNGMWPGDRDNRKDAVTASASYETHVLRTEDDILEQRQLAARKRDTIARFATIASGMKLPVDKFFSKDAVERTPEMEELVETDTPVDEQDIQISDLIPSQETVDTENIEEVIESEKPVDVLITEDGPVLVDGHHRTSAHVLRGEETVPAKIYVEGELHD